MFIADVIRSWLGWCPHARMVKTSQPKRSPPPLDNPTILPDGGPSGSGRVRKGKEIAAESITILARNRQLFWFSFLMFLTFLLSVVADQYIQGISGITAFPGVISSPAILRAVLTFAAAFIGQFVFFFLVAGLIICVSPIPTGTAMTIREGLSRAWSHKRSIAGWTLIGALLWIAAGAFACGFYLITVFSLPAVVLDNRDLVAAIRESVAIFRRMWVETYVSFGIILLISMGFVFVTLFFLGQAAFAYGLVIEGTLAGIIGLVVYVLMAIGLVIMGIAICILYNVAEVSDSVKVMV